MPITAQFEYEKVKTWQEALSLKSAKGSSSKILAGGTDLIVLLRENVLSPDLLIDIKGIPGVNDISLKKSLLTIGANVTFSDIIKSSLVKKNLPALWEAAHTVASVGVRNRATVAGNICSAVPCADSAGPILVYEAEINLLSQKESRKVPAEKWFTGPKKTAIEHGEILHSIEFKIPKSKTSASYLKLSRYEGEDLAQASFTVTLDSEKNYKIAFGSLAPTPRRAYKTESYLKGKKINEETLKQACKIIETEISPISDIRASKDYRLHMAKVMLARALEKVVSRYYKGLPHYGEGLIE
ncbi:MAG: xanthine dehydrogenase family protein subunit M [Elusimicrobiota bacterium]